MSTIFKITFANIGRKKFRTILIILSIVLSVALLYTVLSMSGTITKIFEQKIKKETGNTELIIMPKEEASEPFIQELDFSGISGLSYHIPKLSAYGYTKLNHEDITAIINGMQYKDYTTIYPVAFAKEAEEDLKGNQAMIGEEAAKEYNLTIGDDITITLLGKDYSFHINAILKDQNNNMGYNLGSITLLVSRQMLTELLQLNDQVSSYYLQSDKQTELASIITELEKAYPDLMVKDVTDMQDYKQMIGTITSSLFLMVLAVIMISTFIIYSSFKIIVIERMPLIGTLRSIGATKSKTRTILLLEALFYGLLGGVAGSALGILLLSAALKILFQNFGITLENVSYLNWQYLLISFSIGLLLVLSSALMPILKTSSKSIRSIIFTEIRNEKHLSFIKTVIGMVMIGVAFLLFNIAPLKWQMPLDILGILLVSIGAAMIIPMLSILLTKLLSLLLRPFFKDAFGVTTANIKNDRTIMNNISLLAMGLGVILMINNFSTAVSVAVCDLYAKGKSDVLSFYPVEASFLDQVREIDGVEHVYATKEIQKVSANQGKITFPYLDGIDGEDYCKYAWDEFGEYLTDEVCTEFDNSRSIILSTFLSKKYDLKIGDQLDMDFDGNTKTYKVIAIVPTLFNNGGLSFIHEKFLTEDAKVQYYQGLYLNLDPSENKTEVIQNVKELMPTAILPLQSLEDMQEQNMKSNNAVFFLMRSISLMAMFIGVVGILNNFTISFLSRKKVIATLRSLGLSKRRTIGNMLFEAFLCGCLGTISGLAFGTVLLKAMCYVLDAMGLPSQVLFFNTNDYVFVLISGILLSLLSAILPAISITKENIVEGLRYE